MALRKVICRNKCYVLSQRRNISHCGETACYFETSFDADKYTNLNYFICFLFTIYIQKRSTYKTDPFYDPSTNYTTCFPSQTNCFYWYWISLFRQNLLHVLRPLLLIPRESSIAELQYISVMQFSQNQFYS